MISLSSRTQKNIDKKKIEPQLILEIDGLPLFGAVKVFKTPRFDDPELFFDMPGLLFDTPIENTDAKLLINLAGSTTNITQQLFQDKGLASSVASVVIELVDKDEFITKVISPGVVVDELLSKNATVYLNFLGGAHPEDSVPIIVGVIDNIDAGSGSIKLSVAHPDGLKRQDIFTNIKAKLFTNLRYKSRIINGINFQTQDNVGSIVDVQFQELITPGPVTVNVSGFTIRIGITPNVSTDSDVVSAMSNSQAAVDLVSAAIADGYQNTPQVIVVGPLNPADPDAVTGYGVLDSSTAVTLDSSQAMLPPSSDGTFLTYMRIEDEILQYTGISGDTITGLVPGQFGTIPRTHKPNTDTSTFYRLIGSMKDIALKMMLSQGDALSIKPLFFNSDGINTIPNAIYFDTIDVAERYGISVGDFVSSSGQINSANNFVNRSVIDVVTYKDGSYVVVDGASLTFGGANNTVQFNSRYDVWPDGLGLSIAQVDIQRHEDLQNFFPSGFFNYDFYLSDTITGSDFLAQEVYYPSGCYAIPRGGKSSVGLTLPPLANTKTKYLDDTNVTNASSLVVSRSINRYFYNAVVYEFAPDAVDGQFKKGLVKLSATSTARVKNVKNKPLTIPSKGIRDVDDYRNQIDAQATRFLDRYQYGAEFISADVLYKTGFDIEVGDTVIFGAEKLKVSDSTQGTRDFKLRVMEVQNKKMDIRAGKVTLDLLDTAYSVNSSYGVIGPSSYVGAGSTTTDIVLQRTITTPATENETYKWKPYLGQQILFHNDDWTYTESTTIAGIAGVNNEILVVNPPLSVAPVMGIVADTPQYPDSTDPQVNALWKLLNFYFSPRVSVVAQVSSTVLTVSSGDIAKFYVGSPVRIHDLTFQNDSGIVELKVTDITGNNITLNKPLTFPVDSTFVIDAIGFKDKRPPYRLL